MRNILIIFTSLCTLGCIKCQTEDPIIETDKGLIKGGREFSKSGRIYYAFNGIPYAKPPLGQFRFKPPEEPDNWTGILEANQNAPHCLQKNYLFAHPKVEGSEDCLYLNVYTPKLRARRQTSKPPLLPVMVFIHWGGFFTGYSSPDYLGPEYFMDKNVVLVTFNYRLGVLGFLSTNDDVSPGNYGLKDQVTALKWIQKNIENFWGDPNKVTIFGQSAGAASVHYHMLSLESKNLFQRAISQSGTSLALWAKPQTDLHVILSQTQAKFVGCNDVSNSSVIVDCLRKVDGHNLVESGDKFKIFSVDPLNVFVPAIEKETLLNPRPFITKQPVEYIQNKEFANVPWIIGMVKDEGLIRAEPLMRHKKLRDKINENFDSLMPNLMGLQLSAPKEQIPYLWNRIKDYYFLGKNKIEDYDDVKSFINLYTDRSFAYTTYQTALLHHLNGHKDLWFYHFNYSGEFSYGNHFAGTIENLPYFHWGVSHCDDLLYLFKTPRLFPTLNCPNDQYMIDKLTTLWTNFAYHENPMEDWLKVGGISGNKTGDKRLNYLNFEGNCRCPDLPKVTLRRGIYKSRFNFWESLPLMENIAQLNETQL